MLLLCLNALRSFSVLALRGYATEHTTVKMLPMKNRIAQVSLHFRMFSSLFEIESKCENLK